jgi:hypothetical protein
MFLVVPLVIVGLEVWRVHTKMPYGITKTDLSANGVRNAVATLQRERLMWSHFESLEGDITFDRVDDYTNHSSLFGHISVKQLSSQPQHGVGRLQWPFIMVISNNQEGWVLTSDGENRNNTRIDCKNQKQIEAIKGAFPEVIPSFLLFPKLELVTLWRDHIFPQGGDDMNDILGGRSPWHNQNAQGIPDSYTFKDMSGQFDELSFTNGHLSSWRRSAIEAKDRGQNAGLTFGDYVESDHIWFPTRIEYKSDDEHLSMTLSNIFINNGN